MARSEVICDGCEYSGTNCWIRYYKDILEFGEVEWLCPACDRSHIKKGADKYTCDFCGFGYICQ